MADEKHILGQNVNVYCKMKGMKKEDVARDVEILRSLFHHCNSVCYNYDALLERMVKSMMDHPDEYRIVSFAGYSEKPVHVSITLSRAFEIIWDDCYNGEELATYNFDRNYYALECLRKNSYYSPSASYTEKSNSSVGGGNMNDGNAEWKTTIDNAAKEQAKCCSSSTCKGIQDDKEIKNYFLVDKNLVYCGACLDDNLPLKVKYMSKNDKHASWTPLNHGCGTNESPNNSARAIVTPSMIVATRPLHVLGASSPMSYTYKFITTKDTKVKVLIFDGLDVLQKNHPKSIIARSKRKNRQVSKNAAGYPNDKTRTRQARNNAAKNPSPSRL